MMDIYAPRRKVLPDQVRDRWSKARVNAVWPARWGTLGIRCGVTWRRQRRSARSGGGPSPVMDRVRPRLEQLLEEWAPRTTDKQRITGRRLHRQLREEGYEVGLTLVLAELREWRRRAEVYIPVVHRRAESAQVDFFAVTVELNGERRLAWKFLVRLMHSDCVFGLAP